MKTITTNNRTLLFVEVPVKASRSQVIAEISEHLINGKIFIATTDTVTEEQATEIVEKVKSTLGIEKCFKFYGFESVTGKVRPALDTALNSFQTFLQHHSITGRHAIIEVL